MHLNELVVESRNPGFCLFGSIVNCLEKLLGLLHLWKACFWAEMASCFAELQFTAEYSGECASQIPFTAASNQNSIAAHYGNTTDSAVDELLHCYRAGHLSALWLYPHLWHFCWLGSSWLFPGFLCLNRVTFIPSCSELFGLYPSHTCFTFFRLLHLIYLAIYIFYSWVS